MRYKLKYLQPLHHLVLGILNIFNNRIIFGPRPSAQYLLFPNICSSPWWNIASIIYPFQWFIREFKTIF
jgi:hypothetical protein